MTDINDLLVQLETLNLKEPSTDQIPITSNSSLTKSNNNFIKMAEFRTEYLKCVPEFSGNPNDLSRYLSVCQSIIDSFYIAQQPNHFQNIYILNCIIGKLTGNAKLVLGTQNVNTWDELKNILNRHFADQRDEACLNRDLVMLRQQSNESPSQFYDRVLHILNLLCSYINIHEENDDARILKRNLYNNLALKTYLSGLKEPLGTTIRCMRPVDLPEALQFVTEEGNIGYFQSNSKFQNSSRSSVQNPRFLNNSAQRNVISPGNSYQQNFNFPRQSQSENRMQQNSQFYSQPFINRPTTNVFRPNQNRPLPKPTPMSISTRQTTRFNRPYVNNRNNFQNLSRGGQIPNQSPNFRVEELYNTNVVKETFNPGINTDNYASREGYDEPWGNTSQQNNYYENAESAEFQINKSERNFPRTSQVNTDR